MIAYLRGQLLEKAPDGVVVDVHGVGYKVALSQSSLKALPDAGAPVELRIHTHVREDAILLFGFTSPEEQELFGHLTTVSGVGPKLALNILSGLPAPDLAHAIASNDLARLTKLSGVGKKTAERLVVELADRLKTSALLLRGTASAKPKAKAAGDDLVSALTNLGYRPADAERAASAARESHPDAELAEQVRVALQMLLAKAV